MTDPGRLTRGTPPPPAGVRGAPAEDGASAAAAAAAAEAGPLLPVQRHGAHPAHVRVCPAGPLDGLHLVHHRPQGDGAAPRRRLGHRWVAAGGGARWIVGTS